MKKKPRKQKKRDLKRSTVPKTENLEMSIIHPHAGAADIGSKEQYVCVGLNRDEDVKIFGCSTDELNKLCDWLEYRGVTSFAMESTGHYWYALHDILTSRNKIEVILVNGRFSKNISGRKSDLLDCEWLYKLHSFGLLRGSFLTDALTNELKRLSRHRGTLVGECVRYLGRILKNFRQMNIVLDSELSSFKTVTGRHIIEAIIAGERSAEKLADLANKGVKRDHHSHEIAFDIQGYGYKLWGTDLFDIPGVGRESVLVLISEIGNLKNWQKFPTAGHFAAWLGLLPNNRISGGKVLSNHRLRHDNRVSAALRNAAASLIKESVRKTTALHRFGMRILHKKGKTAAIVALACKIAKIVWHNLSRYLSGW